MIENVQLKKRMTKTYEFVVLWNYTAELRMFVAGWWPMWFSELVANEAWFTAVGEEIAAFLESLDAAEAVSSRESWL